MFTTRRFINVQQRRVIFTTIDHVIPLYQTSVDTIDHDLLPR